MNSKDNSNFGMKDKEWWNRNTEDSLCGSGVGSTILRNTLFGKKKYSFEEYYFEKLIYDKIEKSSLFKE